MHQTLLKKAVAKVFVTVVEAADLLASNSNGKSDPFCVVKLGNSQELATPIIMGTLCPHWNHTVSGARDTFQSPNYHPVPLHRWNSLSLIQRTP